MTNRIALLISIVSAVFTGGSLYLNYSAFQRSEENLSIALAVSELLILEGSPYIIWSGTTDIYNLSTEKVTLTYATMTGGVSYSWPGPDPATYRIGDCGTNDQQNTVLESRTSYEVPFSCRIRGGPKATAYLKTYLRENPDQIQARNFLSALYEAEGIDFFDEILPGGLNGVSTSVTSNRTRDPQYGTSVFVPFRFLVSTRTKKWFEDTSYLFLGASSNR